MAITREPLDPTASFWHFLAYQLRFVREQHGLSLAQWGRIIGAARSTVSNIEANRRKIDDAQAKVIDDHCGTGRLFQVMLWFARTTHDPDWFRQYTVYESEADVIRAYQGQIIPVPLQTEDYARAIQTTADIDDIDKAVAGRRARKDAVLGRTQPALLWVLLDEAVLDRPIGGAQTMRDQLQHLLELSDLPRVSIRVVPKSAGAYVGLGGSFQVMSLKSRDVVYVGAHRGGRLVEASAEAREYGLDYERIGAKLYQRMIHGR
ncbi:helix-turn-helix transcriptional regulator [Actinomadura barringtoniae]|uniref:Helix-turn-helix transcriptional regulator n=1 Tax=Actinomadura barringtoniae TaxID=1427535 RepID=A0A939T1F4_9ACTN|nr:helix-turn-helix transcriptional regulator [Actinomadura barringtoniae]MBO2447426.1 helix-turn-helix transcriptional regulator [Actinomadura barringtoniae]